MYAENLLLLSKLSFTSKENKTLYKIGFCATRVHKPTGEYLLVPNECLIDQQSWEALQALKVKPLDSFKGYYHFNDKFLPVLDGVVK